MRGFAIGVWLGVAILVAPAGGCHNVTDQRAAIQPGDVAAAVADRDSSRVQQLLRAGASANDSDERGEPALLIATASDQFGIANALVAHGADIWAASDLGFTAGSFAYHSVASGTHPEAGARDQFIATLRERGFPWPPPRTDDVVKMREAGNWPPRRR
jgi:hypothetical protein